MPSRRQRKARAAAAPAAVAVAAKPPSADIPSPNSRRVGGEEAEIRIEDREDGVRLELRPVPGATRQWISWRCAPLGGTWGNWQAQVSDDTGRAEQIFVPFERTDGVRYEFHRGYRDQQGESHFRGVVQSQVNTKINKRGAAGTGDIGPGAEDPGAEQKPGHWSMGTGVNTLEQKRSSAGTLEHDLGGRTRKPKPRNAGYIDEKVWSGAKEAARGQVKQEYCIPGCLDAYYRKMCQPGRLLLADEVHRRTQAVYDYRAGKIVYRENRRNI